MNSHSEKNIANRSHSSEYNAKNAQNNTASTFKFEDNRKQAVAQIKMQEIANNSEQVSQLSAFQEMAIISPQVNELTQLQSIENDHVAAQQNPIQKKPNNTGLPDNLKTGIENLSGYSMDDVKVEYNSSKPAQLNAYAYAQGSQIHLGSGQEKHLPHEAWHVVQQKQGRVKPTMQMKSKVNINDDAGLEKEADVMGARALQTNIKKGIVNSNSVI